MRFVTIGGYGFTEEAFVAALRSASVDTFVDVRQRRGVRGARYSFLNSTRLQALLAAAGIRYAHAIQLAPTAEIRNAQKRADAETGVRKRERTKLSLRFRERYNAEVLSKLDLSILEEVTKGSDVVALFCVEKEPDACHRSLAAEYLVRALRVDTPPKHLHP